MSYTTKDIGAVCSMCSAAFLISLQQQDRGRGKLCSKKCAMDYNRNIKWKKYHDSLRTKFWERVDSRGGGDACWLYTGSKRSNGYGRLRVDWKHEAAHRMAVFYSTGVHPGDGFVMHSCDNPPCCNPRHLSIGTHSDNMRDRSAKGRSPLHRAVLNQAQADDIRGRLERGDMACKLAREYEVSETCISRIKLGKTWNGAALRARSAG